MGAKGKLVFEALKASGDAKALSVQRARVLGGWLVVAYLEAALTFKSASVTFYPDPEHKWDGASLPEDTTEAEEVEETDNRLFGSRRGRRL